MHKGEVWVHCVDGYESFLALGIIYRELRVLFALTNYRT
jgi:hypothetical protein